MPCDYPIFLDLAGRQAVVVGGGAIAARRVYKLLAAGAKVRVVAPQIDESILALAQHPGEHSHAELVLLAECFSPHHLAGAVLAFACTDSPQVNAAVAAAARAGGSLVNSADDPENCDFFMPAVSEHGPVKIAISTGGSAPALARFVRELLDEHLPAELGLLAGELADLRPRVQRLAISAAARAELWRKLCSSESIRQLREAGQAGWQAWAERLISS